MTYTDKSKTDGVRLPNFAELMDHLKGILAPHLPKESFMDATHAHLCGCSISTYSRKKAGLAPFYSNELGRLIHMFNLGPEFTYRDFYGTLDELDAKLRRFRKGSYSTDPATELRNILHWLADPNKPITVKRVAHRQVGGIGGDPSLMPNPILRNGDQVQIVVPLPPHAKNGHLIVLNYSPVANGGVSFLMPSHYAPETHVAPYPVTLPTKDSLDPSFPVSIPEGSRPVFAIWSAADPKTFVSMPDKVDEQVAQLSQATLEEIITTLRRDGSVKNEDFLVFRGEYEVRTAS